MTQKIEPDKEMEFADYRETDEARCIIGQIEELLRVAGEGVTAASIARRVAVPRGWSLTDLMGASRHIVHFVAYPADLYAWDAAPAEYERVEYGKYFGLKGSPRYEERCGIETVYSDGREVRV